MRIKSVVISLATLLLAMCVACSSRDNVNASSNRDVKDQVSKALDSAGYKDVKVDVNRDKQLVTLSGEVKSDQDKQRAEQAAKDSAGNFVVSNEIGVRPEGASSDAKKIDSNLDTAIEHDFKAEIVANRLDRQKIKYEAKNGVLTLTGKVRSAAVRDKVEELASKVPNVRQVVNQIDISGPQPARTRSGSGL
ncbi:MAG TPA: BON domain-containing protein [Candidatus Angelobacter sp.]|nr:BON domain-containing protein [Candidatus Angelobacter sp.]